MIAEFQENPHAPSLFVLTLKTGGLGLNLTAANHVFHYDRWWNPAVEDQASDRAYRIGQIRNVQIHKFITAGTVEEAIDALIERKQGLMEAIIGTEESWLADLSDEELAALVTLSRERV
jgi:SNF2 family DNA or RNA helicase